MSGRARRECLAGGADRNDDDSSQEVVYAHSTLMRLAAISAVIACNEPAAPTGSQPTRPEFITNGVPTGSDFGAVGALLFDFGADGSLDGLCTGSLISPTVFLTAAHCLFSLPPIVQLYVTFDPALSLPPGPLIAVGGVSLPS